MDMDSGVGMDWEQRGEPAGRGQRGRNWDDYNVITVKHFKKKVFNDRKLRKKHLVSLSLLMPHVPFISLLMFCWIF